MNACLFLWFSDKMLLLMMMMRMMTMCRCIPILPLLTCITELPDQRPEVVVELANTVAYEGTVGRFRCKFHGQPEPQVKW